MIHHWLESIRFCKPAGSKTGGRIIPWDSKRMYKSSVLLVLCCLALGSNAVPIPSSKSVERRSIESSNKDHCLHHIATPSISCSFHDTCIESTYQCGTLGLALGYAQPRCEELRLLRHSESSCSRCVQNDAILDWILFSEQCFQSGLLQLAQNQTAKKLPDPPDCLNFEIDALHILEQCYSENNSICQLMDSTSFDVLESDLKVVLNAVTVSSYYKSIVMKQFRDLISSCSHSEAPSLATKVSPETESMLLCASFLTGNKLTEEGLTQALAGKLNQSYTDFKVASQDNDHVFRCQVKSDPGWNVGSAGYYLVHWTLSTGANKAALTLCQEFGLCSIDNSQLVYFEYTSPTTSSCGNGVREAGESCDLFVYTGEERYGCSKQCHTIPGHECTTHHLEQSSCSKTKCGDGLRTSDEECDGGTASNVGCNPKSCTVEEGYKCETDYNVTSHCTELPAPTQIAPTSSTVLTTSLPTQPVQPLEAVPSNGGLTSGAHSIQRTLHLWSAVLTPLLALLLFHLIWR